MSSPSDPQFLVLHGLRLKGFATTAVLADVCGLRGEDVTTHLETLEAQRLVRARTGRLSGWSLTPEGRARHATRCAAEVDASGCRGSVADCYSRFLELNAELLAACTAWQVVGDADSHVLNDHTNEAYDAGVVDRLQSLHAAIVPVCADLASSLERFGRYAERLGAALQRIQRGEVEWFTGALVESYHAVWFELHEDLLATLGIERAAEVPA